jgi:ABC-type antimicrobial peptide transport system permease subunit
MRKAVLCLASLVVGYLVGAGLGAAAIELFSANTHDRSVEMAMTAAFVTGPIGAVIGLIAGWIGARRG